MRPGSKAPFLLILVVAVAGFALVTAAQWAYPVRQTPTPEMGERWRQWATDIRAKAASSPSKPTPAVPSADVPVRTAP